MAELREPQLPQLVQILLVLVGHEVSPDGMRGHDRVAAAENDERRARTFLWPELVLVPEEVPRQRVGDVQLPGEEIVDQQLRRVARLPVHEIVADVGLHEEEAHRVHECHHANEGGRLAGHPRHGQRAEGMAHEVRFVEAPTREHVRDASDHLRARGHLLLNAHGNVRQGDEEEAAVRHPPQELVDEGFIRQEVHADAVAENDGHVLFGPGLAVLCGGLALPMPIHQCAAEQGLEAVAAELEVDDLAEDGMRHGVVHERTVRRRDRVHRETHATRFGVVPGLDVQLDPSDDLVGQLLQLREAILRNVPDLRIPEGPRHPLQHVAPAQVPYSADRPSLRSSRVDHEPAAGLGALERDDLRLVHELLGGQAFGVCHSRGHEVHLARGALRVGPIPKQLLDTGLVVLAQQALQVRRARLRRHPVPLLPRLQERHAPAVRHVRLGQFASCLDELHGLERLPQVDHRLPRRQQGRVCAAPLELPMLVAVVQVEHHLHGEPHSQGLPPEPLHGADERGQELRGPPTLRGAHDGRLHSGVYDTHSAGRRDDVLEDLPRPVGVGRGSDHLERPDHEEADEKHLASAERRAGLAPHMVDKGAMLHRADDPGDGQQQAAAVLPDVGPRARPVAGIHAGHALTAGLPELAAEAQLLRSSGRQLARGALLSHRVQTAGRQRGARQLAPGAQGARRGAVHPVHRGDRLAARRLPTTV
mmetsp:Transcript_4262/g.11910  ORF Transcript_4262/g.11910 Transcript_4262/m.11910 type:complete len:704 (-) Transcript_4262:134-2245(-)